MRKFKNKVRIISFVMGFLMFLLSFADITVFAAEKNIKAYAEEQKKIAEQEAVTIVRELKEYNTEYATFYEKSDGNIYAEHFFEPIRIRNEKGELVDIDTSLEKIKSNEYSTKATDTQIKINEDINAHKAITLTKDNYEISMNVIKDQVLSVAVDEDLHEQRQQNKKPENLVKNKIKALANTARQKTNSETKIGGLSKQTKNILTNEKGKSTPTNKQGDTSKANDQETDASASDSKLNTNELNKKSTANITDTKTEKSYASDKEQNNNAVLDERDNYIYTEDAENAQDIISKSKKRKAGGKDERPAKVEAIYENGDSNKEINGIRYSNTIEDNINIDIIPTSKGIKEEIILYAKPGNEWFSYELNVSSNIAVEMNEYYEVSFRDKINGEEVGFIPSPFMFDSADEQNESDDIIVEVIKVEDTKYIYSMKPSGDFLNDSKTVYPVTLDPQILITTDNGIMDTMVSSAEPNRNFKKFTSLKVGRDTANTIFRSFVKTTNLTDVGGHPSLNFISKAQLCLYQAYNGSSSPQIKVQGMVTPIDYNTVTYNTIAGKTLKVIPADMQTVKGMGWYGFDITNLFRHWKRGGANYGMMISSNNEGSQYYKRFNAREMGTLMPHIKVDYITVTGSGTPRTNGINSGGGHISWQWTPYSGATEYRVAMTNGITYNTVSVGTKTTYDTNGSNMPAGLKNVWPTAAEIANGRTTLHTDGAGRADLPNSPMDLYNNSKGTNLGHKYGIRVDYYDKYGLMGSLYVSSKLSDATMPGKVPNVTAVRDASKKTITIKWGRATDYPIGLASGIKEYTIYMQYSTSSPTAFSKIATVNANTFSYVVSELNFSYNRSATFYVVAKDNNGNYESISKNSSKSSAIWLPDRSKPQPAGSVTIKPSTCVNKNPTVNWSGFKDADLSHLEVSFDNTGKWQRINNFVNTAPGSTIWTNGMVINLADFTEGAHTVHIRAIDRDGNIGTSKSATFKKDTVLPAVNINLTEGSIIRGTYNITGTVKDLNLTNWKIKLKKGNKDASGLYSTVYTSNTAVNTASTLHTLNTINLDNNQIYTIMLEATDAAGNVGRQEKSVMVSQNGQVIKNKFTVTSPVDKDPTDSDSKVYVTDPIQKFTYTAASGTVIDTPSELFIDNKKVAVEKSAGAGFDFNVVASNFADGTEHTFYIKNTKADAYSGGVYQYNQITESFNSANDFAALSNVNITGGKAVLVNSAQAGYLELKPFKMGMIDELTLVGLVGSGNVTFEYKDGNTWVALNKSVTNNLRKQFETLSVRIKLSPNSMIDGITFRLKGIQKNTFTVKLIEPASNLTAIENANYTIWLRWDPSPTPGVAYQVYRGDTENFTPDVVNKSNLIREGVTDHYIYDYDIRYGHKNYYKVIATKDFSNVKRHSLPTAAIGATVVDEGELDKNLGIQSFWDYGVMPVGSGEGYINVSNGNLVYQKVDFVDSSPVFASLFRRTYNSGASYKTALGNGWDYNYNTNLMNEYDKAGNKIGLILKDGDGTLHRFRKEADGSYSSPKGIYMKLTVNGDGTVQIKRADNITYNFNSNMQLESFSEPNGNRINLDYDNRGNMVKAYHNVYSDYQDADVQQSTSHYIQAVYDQSTDKLKFVGNHFKDISSGKSAVDIYYYVYNGDGNIHGLKTDFSGQFMQKGDDWMNVYGVDTEQYSYEGGFEVSRRSNKHGSSEWVETKFTADSNNRIVKVSDARGDEKTISYQSGTTQINSWQGFASAGKKLGHNIFTYNGDGIMLSFENSIGQRVEKSNYDSNYNPRTVKVKRNSAGYDTYTYTYDSQGNILSMTDPGGKTSSYAYDAGVNKVTRETVPSAAGTSTTSYTYDSKGNMTSMTTPDGKTTTYTYTAKGYRASETSFNDFKRTYEYDDYGRVIKVNEKTSANEYRTSRTDYDIRNNPVKETDVLGRVTNNKYNEQGQKTETVYPNGKIEKWEYNLNGIPVLKRENNYSNRDATIITEYHYDELDRQIKTVKGSGSDAITETVSYSYTSGGNALKRTRDGAGRITTEEYDFAGRKVKESFGDGGIYTAYTYDLIGNNTSITDQTGNTTTAQYNSSNQRIKVSANYSGSEKAETTYTYDNAGNVLTETDRKGNVKTNTYDVNNRLKSVTQTVDGKSLTTRYEYDQPVSTGVYKNTVTSADGSKIETHFDRLGRQVTEKEIGKNGSLIRTKTFKYDKADNLLSETVDGIERIKYDYYSNENLVKKKTFDSGSFTEYTYDLDGNQLTMSDMVEGSRSNTNYSYDLFGRMTMMHQDGDNISYTYDGAGNIIELGYDKGGEKSRILTYEFDQYERVTGVKQNGKTVKSYSYDSKGRMTNAKEYLEFASKADKSGEVIDQNVIYDNYTGMPTSIEYKKGSGVIEKYETKYDKLGYITSEKISSTYDGKTKELNNTYEYDAIGRLSKDTLSVKKDGKTETKSTTYTYDSVGNRLSMNQGSDSYVYSYNDANLLTGISKNGVKAEEYEYDALGNQSKKKTYKQEGGAVKLDETATYEYNKGNQLKKITTKKEGIAELHIQSYMYNGDGKRIRYNANGADPKKGHKYYYVGDSLLYTASAVTGEKLTENVLDKEGGIIATRGESAALQYDFYHYDIRGSVTNIVKWDINRVKAVQEYEYDVFGKTEQVKGESATKNEVKFTGALHENNSGLYYMNARHYDPNTGRFLQQDVYKGDESSPWTQNRYTYCGNNPVNMIDPSGHFFISIIVGGIVSAGVNAGLQYLTNGRRFDKINWWKVAASGISGLVGGGISNLKWGVKAFTLLGAVTGASNEAIDAVSEKRSVNWGRMALNTTVGAVIGTFTGGISKTTYNLKDTTMNDVANAVIGSNVSVQTSVVDTVIDNSIYNRQDKKKKNTNIFKKVGNTVKSKVEKTVAPTIGAAGAGMAFLLGRQVINTIKDTFKRFWGW